MAIYPDDFDIFTTKQNVTPGMEETTGDYVRAEHINDLQKSVTNIQQTLGKSPQGQSSTVGERIADLENSRSLKIPSFCIFSGNPLTFNGATTVTQAANEFLYYDYIVLGSGYENPNGINYESIQALLFQIRSSRDVKIYGAIDVGVTTSNLTLSQIEIRIANWDALEVDGIFLDNFGYDCGVARTRQNDIIGFIHNRGLSAFIRATNDSDVFQARAPDWIEPLIDFRDIYLHDNLGVNTSSGTYVDSIDKCVRLAGYRKSYGVRIFGLATISSTLADSVAQEYFNYAQAIAILYSYDGFYATTEGFGSISGSQRLYDSLSLIGNYLDGDPQIVASDASTYYRIGNFGKLILHTDTHTYEFDGISIPGENITGTVDVNALIGSVVGAINANPESIIDAARIAELTVPHIKSIVIDAINDTINNNHGGIYSDRIASLHADKITAGNISADRMRANVVSAINAFVNDLTVEQINAGVIDADAIRATVLDAINVTAGQATIEAAKIGELSADKITSGTLAVQGEMSVAGGGIILDEDGIRSDSGSFSIGSDGNVAITGEIDAQTGAIAGWNIDENSINTPDDGKTKMIYVGAGNYANSDTPVYISGGSNENKFSLGENLSYDGENIIIKRGMIFGGKLDGIFTESLIINSRHSTSMYQTNYMTATAPTNEITPIGLTQEMSDNGTLTYTLSWTPYVQGGIEADFILVYWKEGENVGQPLTGDNCYALMLSESSYIFRNFISEKFYNFGVAAARRENNAIEVGRIISPTTWQNVTQGTPDFNWSLDGRLAEELSNIVYKVEIISSDGISFRNGNVNTILQAKVYHGADDITDTIDSSKFQWTRTSSNATDDSIWNFNHAGGYKAIEVTSEDVFGRASFTCTVSE